MSVIERPSLACVYVALTALLLCTASARAAQHHGRMPQRAAVFQGNLAAYLLGAANDSDSVTISPGPRLHLEPNAPNPFEHDGGTTISFSLEERASVRLAVYDSFYRLVTVLLDEERGAGRTRVRFVPAALPQGIASGFYFYELTAGSQRLVGRMMLMK